MACTMYLVLGCIGIMSCKDWELEVGLLEGERHVGIVDGYCKLD